MKPSPIIILAALLLTAAVPKLNAYELPVHAQMTNEAYKKSILADAEFLNRLGLENDVDPFGITYYDVFVDDAIERTRDKFERLKMPEGAEPLSIEGWLMRGAIREDDFVFTFSPKCLPIAAPNPKDDLYPKPPSRPLNHFFDPHFFDRPLTVLGIKQGQRAPDWALGSIDEKFNQPLQLTLEDTNRRNHFTVFDAIESQYGHDRS